jgi:hypothetical protein
MYVNQLPELQQEPARQRLSLLIRCPHLSSYWLSASVLSASAPELLLHALNAPLQRLLLLRNTDPGFEPTAAQIEELIPGAPASWGLEKRKSKSVTSVHMTWHLSVSQLRDAAQRSAKQQSTFNACFSPNLTPLLGGLSWLLHVQCEYEATPAGPATKIGVFTRPSNACSDMYYRFTFSLSTGAEHTRFKAATWMATRNASFGCTDFFSMGAMKDGWDEVKWADQGWPATGEIPITVTIARYKDT